MKSNNIRVIPYVLIAVCLGELATASVRYAATSFTPLNLAFIRITIAFISSATLLLNRIDFSKYKNLSANELAITTLTGISWGFAIYFIGLAALETKLSSVSFIAATLPLFVYLLSLALLSTKFDYKVLPLFIISIYGVSIVSSKSFIPTFTTFGLGEVYSLISVLFFTICFIGRKILSKKLNAIEVTAATTLFAILPLFYLTISHGEFYIKDSITTLSGGAIIFSGIAIAIGTIFNNAAIKLVHPALVSQITLVRPLFASTIGLLFFAEIPHFTIIIGGLIIILSVYITNRLVVIK